MECAYGLQVVTTSVVIPLGIFNVSSTFFFSTRDILSPLVGSEINAAAFHGTIMMLQFFQLHLCYRLLPW